MGGGADENLFRVSNIHNKMVPFKAVWAVNTGNKVEILLIDIREMWEIFCKD